MVCDALTSSGSLSFAFDVGLTASGLTFLLCGLASYWVLGRKFDAIVGEGTGPEYWMGWIGRFVMRPQIFAMLIVFDPDWQRVMHGKGRRAETHPAE